MRARRSAQFERRSALYTRLDSQWRGRTRFFAAAALINAAFARLFEFGPAMGSLSSFSFLSHVGAALEEDNVLLAGKIGQIIAVPSVDYVLVCAEQAQLQRHVRAHRLSRPRHWESVRGELNGLLNERCAASFISRWCDGVGPVCRVLRQVRECLGTTLDFGTESHRIHIGMTLIEQIRRQTPLSAATYDACAQRLTDAPQVSIIS